MTLGLLFIMRYLSFRTVMQDIHVSLGISPPFARSEWRTFRVGPQSITCHLQTPRWLLWQHCPRCFCTGAGQARGTCNPRRHALRPEGPDSVIYRPLVEGKLDAQKDGAPVPITRCSSCPEDSRPNEFRSRPFPGGVIQSSSAPHRTATCTCHSASYARARACRFGSARAATVHSRESDPASRKQMRFRSQRP
jgi:hypothetical protein